MNATSDLYAVRRFDLRTRRALGLVASGLTRDDARTLAASLRADDDAHGYQMTAAPLAEQAAAHAAPSTAARLASAARAVSMRAAHAEARTGDAATPYADRLAAALRTPAPRRCPLPALRQQAAELVAVCVEAGARFDYVTKACDALRFSAEHDARSLCVPSKLVGVASYQDAAAALASRLDSRGGWVLTERDGATVYALGLQLGDVQPKHGRWLAPLGAVRVAVTQATGGRVVSAPDGRLVRTTRGVNVAFEVGPALALRIQTRAYAAHVEDIRAGRLVEVGPGIYVEPARAASYGAAVARAGGHGRAWGRLD